MRKMDEMELKIRDTAIRWSWNFVLLALFAWGTWMFVKTREMSLPMIVFFMQMVVYHIATLVQQIRLGEKNDRKKLISFMMLLFFLIFAGISLYQYLS